MLGHKQKNMHSRQEDIQSPQAQANQRKGWTVASLGKQRFLSTLLGWICLKKKTKLDFPLHIKKIPESKCLEKQQEVTNLLEQIL